jgi:mono/diheme cytochrome c family protein
MFPSAYRPVRRQVGSRLMRLGLIVGGLLCIPGGLLSADAETAPKGNAEAGRSLFNGKGLCSYCHGMDGHRDRLPQLEAGTSTLIARLTPPPADLRNPKRHRLRSDNARAKIIREGHEGTGMFPDTTLRDQEIVDLLAYLALLRREGDAVPHNRGKKP